MGRKLSETMIEKFFVLTNRINQLEERIEKLEKNKYMDFNESEEIVQLRKDLHINELLKKTSEQSLTSNESSDIWEIVLNYFKDKLTKDSYNCWFKNLIPVKCVDNKFLVQAPDLIVRDWVDQRYKEYISDLLSEILTNTEFIIYV